MHADDLCLSVLICGYPRRFLEMMQSHGILTGDLPLGALGRCRFARHMSLHLLSLRPILHT
jgi:hypothetical protein